MEESEDTQGHALKDWIDPWADNQALVLEGLSHLTRLRAEIIRSNAVIAQSQRVAQDAWAILRACRQATHASNQWPAPADRQSPNNAEEMVGASAVRVQLG